MRGPNRNKDELLSLMRYWLFGTFIIVFAATSAFAGLFTGASLSELIGVAWPVWLITLIVTLGVYLVYLAYHNRYR